MQPGAEYSQQHSGNLSIFFSNVWKSVGAMSGGRDT
jgi:hypothetical protein